MSEKVEVPTAWVTEVLRTAARLSTDDDAQLTMLARAFAVACRSRGVRNYVALDNLEELLNAPMQLELVPLYPRPQ